MFYPYPGTSLFELCQQRGYLPDNYLELPANNRESILHLPDLTKEQIASYYDRFTHARERNYLKQYGAGLGPQDRALVKESIFGHAATG